MMSGTCDGQTPARPAQVVSVLLQAGFHNTSARLNSKAAWVGGCQAPGCQNGLTGWDAAVHLRPDLELNAVLQHWAIRGHAELAQEFSHVRKHSGEGCLAMIGVPCDERERRKQCMLRRHYNSLGCKKRNQYEDDFVLLGAIKRSIWADDYETEPATFEQEGVDPQRKRSVKKCKRPKGLDKSEKKWTDLVQVMRAQYDLDLDPTVQEPVSNQARNQTSDAFTQRCIEAGLDGRHG